MYKAKRIQKRFLNDISMSDNKELMNILSGLVKNSNSSNTYVLVNIYDYSHFSEFNQVVHSPLKPDIHYQLSKENFITKMFDISITHNIIDIKYSISGDGKYSEINVNVYIEKTSDHTSNITVEMMEMFCKLPIVTLNSSTT